MWIKNERRGIKLLLGIVALILLAGCAASPGASQDTAQLATATPDPLSLQCIHQSGRNDYCYTGDLLAEDPALLEKASRRLCLDGERYWCFIYIWKDEESVAGSHPLTDAESSSMIAKFTSNPQTGLECFQAYSNGEVIYSSGNCE